MLVFGHTLVTASDDYTIRLWDIVTKECTRELTGVPPQLPPSHFFFCAALAQL